MLQACSFQSSDGKHTYTITQNITCNSIGVVYYAVCPCGKIYVGLTSRPLKNTRVPRHFKRRHNSNAKLLKVIGIDKVYIDQRGGNWRKNLAQLEAKWIFKINSVQPHGLNEVLSFAPFL
ncbi:unnamed protein product [Ranitomeya imitator]|uniref:GIY-YIG domain-containing protein n=1 Tax=Ranitomeya imitator TaxID=111125 RepID=A0ABN9LLA2_9NEOB|nr:unnamed protein product [Ranitomeya imitator]